MRNIINMNFLKGHSEPGRLEEKETQGKTEGWI